MPPAGGTWLSLPPPRLFTAATELICTNSIALINDDRQVAYCCWDWRYSITWHREYSLNIHIATCVTDVMSDNKVQGEYKKVTHPRGFCWYFSFSSACKNLQKGVTFPYSPCGMTCNHWRLERWHRCPRHILRLLCMLTESLECRSRRLNWQATPVVSANWTLKNCQQLNTSSPS